ncbi:MAG: DUF4404 family protein [Planctomycetes bacterium]|nr:DUF4404 family protein [Planctomycetota bacterium]
MSDAVQNLRDTLNQLHQQLEAAPDIDPEMRALLAVTVQDIHARLEGGADTESDSEPPESIPDRLSEAIGHFEGSHPTLAGTLGSIIDALSRMGI